MSDGVCDICHVRPAVVRVRATVNGQAQALELCQKDYEALQRQQGRTRSPLEALFGNHPFGGFSGSPFGNDLMDEDEFRMGPRQPRETVNVADVLSERAKDILQQAAHHAHQRNHKDVDTEDLLFALTDADVVQALLEQVKVDPKELRRYIDENAPRGDNAPPEGEIGVTPRLKDALSRSLGVARDMGHSYVGPEHLMVGLAEEGEGLAAETLKKYGISPQSLRQQITRLVGEGADPARSTARPTLPNSTRYRAT